MPLIEKEVTINRQNRQIMPLRNGTDQKIGVRPLNPLTPTGIETFCGMFKIS
jgi:hypothetical protein